MQMDHVKFQGLNHFIVFVWKLDIKSFIKLIKNLQKEWLYILQRSLFLTVIVWDIIYIN